MRRIGKCGQCKQTSARDYTDTKSEIKREWAQVGVSTYERTVTYFARTDKFGHLVRASQDAECPRCGAMQWHAKRIEGFKTDETCGGKCRNAKGPQCECSCGGENHGKGYLVCEAVAA
jgi:hypothetical protein